MHQTKPNILKCCFVITTALSENWIQIADNS